MEPSVLVVILLICLLAAFFAWILGVWGTPPAVWAVALTGFILTGLGTAIVLATHYLWAPAVQAGASGGGPNLLAGLVIAIPLVLGWGVELPGIVLTLAVCLIGMVQTARKRSAWFWVLLGGALAPILALALTELYLPTIAHLQVDISVYYALQWDSGSITLVSAAVTTIYSRRAARLGRRSATLPTRQEATTDAR